jgi:hypothetical protein
MNIYESMSVNELEEFIKKQCRNWNSVRILPKTFREREIMENNISDIKRNISNAERMIYKKLKGGK